MKRIAEQDMILADTGPFCRLAEAGEAHLDAAARYLEPNVQVVIDVHKELRRRSTVSVHARLTRLELLGVPREEPITITDKDLLYRVEAILEGRRRHKPGHEREDRGEVTTALVAADLGVPVIMDDGFGKRLAAHEGVEVFTTQDLAVELATYDALGSLHAYGIYRIVHSAGQGFVERRNHVHLARNEGNKRVVVLVTYLGLKRGVNPDVPAETPGNCPF